MFGWRVSRCVVIWLLDFLLGCLVCGCVVVWLLRCLLGCLVCGWLVVWLFEGLVGGWVATRKTEIQIRRRAESEASIYALYTVQLYNMFAM